MGCDDSARDGAAQEDGSTASAVELDDAAREGRGTASAVELDGGAAASERPQSGSTLIANNR